jgi:hypothetical protein
MTVLFLKIALNLGLMILHKESRIFMKFGMVVRHQWILDLEKEVKDIPPPQGGFHRPKEVKDLPPQHGGCHGPNEVKDIHPPQGGCHGPNEVKDLPPPHGGFHRPTRSKRSPSPQGGFHRPKEVKDLLLVKTLCTGKNKVMDMIESADVRIFFINYL